MGTLLARPNHRVLPGPSFRDWPPLAETHQQLLLRKLVKQIGREEVATHLGVPISLLDEWIEGHTTMPTRNLVVLAQVVDRVLHT